MKVGNQCTGGERRPIAEDLAEEAGHVHLPVAVGAPQVRTGARDQPAVRDQVLAVEGTVGVPLHFGDGRAPGQLGDRLGGVLFHQGSAVGAGNGAVSGLAERLGPLSGPQQSVPAAFQRFLVRSDGPRPFQLDARMLPRHQVGQQRPREVLARARGAERGLPFVRAVLPIHFFEAVEGVEGGEFLLARAVDACVVHVRRGAVVRLVRAHGNGNRDGGLNGEDVVAFVRAVAFAAQVENPEIVANAPNVFAHAPKSVAVEIARRGDEADDTRAVGRVVLEHLPQCPTPEIDVEIVEVLEADAVAGVLGRLEEVFQDGEFLASCQPGFRGLPCASRACFVRTPDVQRVAEPHPAAVPGQIVLGIPVHGVVSVVGRVAQADENGGVFLDFEVLATLVGNGAEKAPELRRLGVRALQGIGQIHACRAGGRRSPVAQGAADAQLAHRVRADHHLEAVQIACQFRGLSGDGSRALFGFDAAQSVFDDAEEIRADAGGGIERDDAGVGETERFVQATDEQVVHQADLRADDLDRGVVGAGILAQFGIVGGQKVFVEVEPRVLRSGERGGLHDGDDAQQQVERRGHVRAGFAIGQNSQGARQQAVLCSERVMGAVERERVGPLAAAQQQGEGDRLGVGVGELRVRGVGEQ